MKNELVKSGLYAGLIALALGAVYTATTLVLDWRMRSTNPARYDELISKGEIQSLFVPSQIIFFMIRIFVVIFIVMLINAYIQKRKK
jgi:hypothetical protein